MWVAWKTLLELALPPACFFILAVVGLGLRRWLPRLGLALLWSGLGLFFVFSVPAVSRLLTPDLADMRAHPPPWPQADAVVILGGGRRLPAPEYGQAETVSALSLERLRYGAWVARHTGKPILVSGGSPLGDGERPEAVVMAAVLADEFRLPARWVEPRSVDTRQNAVFSAALLRPEGVGTIYLVTQAWHMPKARRMFEAQGLRVIPLPIGGGGGKLSWTDFLPSFRGLGDSRALFYLFLSFLQR